MIIISTNPVTAEPRRKINNGKEEHLCWAEPQQRIYTRLRSSASEKYSYNERRGEKKGIFGLDRPTREAVSDLLFCVLFATVLAKGTFL